VSREFVVPDVVRARVLADGAGTWLEELPRLVGGLAEEWGIAIGRVLTGGSEAFVAEATRRDGTEVVLKVLYPGTSNSAAHEIAVLRLANGEGCAKLFEADAERGAMLLERLGEPLAERHLPFDEQVAVLCDTARHFWRSAAGCGFMTGAEKGRWLIEFVSGKWEELGRPCSESAVTYALGCVERRIAAHDDERSVLVHGDIHEWNALAANGAYKLIDPDGLLAEAEYDLGVLARFEPLESLRPDPRKTARSLAIRTGLSETATWEWGAIERVSSALVCLGLGLEEVGREMLKAAEVCAKVLPRD